ncbi:MAG: sugar phosphate isomerase/epimerase family protein [Acutalibacteraceae bacterium]
MNKNIRIFGFADEASPMIDEQIKAMHRNGLDGLEIRNVDETNVADITLDKAREVRKKLDAAGLVTWSIGSPIGKIDIEKDDFAAHLEKLKHTLEIANILGAENIRMFSFFMPQNKDSSIFKNEVLDRLGKMAEIANGTGVTLCHENEKGIYGDVAAHCLEIFNTVPQIKGIFDPANFVQSGENTIEAWNLLKTYIKYVHVKDARASDDMIVPAGSGDGNFKVIVPEYIAMGGNCFTMEPHLKEFDGLAGLEREGEESKVGEFNFETGDEAFDYACNAFKKILEN